LLALQRQHKLIAKLFLCRIIVYGEELLLLVEIKVATPSQTSRFAMELAERGTKIAI
jgi:hypothetical protein